MADIAIPRNAASPETVAQERADEGRWESEGGPPVYKPLGREDKSAEAPLSEMLKPSEYDPSAVHPSVIEGAAGNVEDSKYPHSGDVKGGEADKSDSEAKPPVAHRKKSITEKLTETWHDIKARADALVHRKNSRDSKDSAPKDVKETPTKD